MQQEIQVLAVPHETPCEAFWILGLLNNFLWVVLNAGANEINSVACPRPAVSCFAWHGLLGSVQQNVSTVCGYIMFTHVHTVSVNQ